MSDYNKYNMGTKGKKKLAEMPTLRFVQIRETSNASFCGNYQVASIVNRVLNDRSVNLPLVRRSNHYCLLWVVTIPEPRPINRSVTLNSIHKSLNNPSNKEAHSLEKGTYPLI